jgi:hypothetical protein
MVFALQQWADKYNESLVTGKKFVAVDIYNKQMFNCSGSLKREKYACHPEKGFSLTEIIST